RDCYDNIIYIGNGAAFAKLRITDFEEVVKKVSSREIDLEKAGKSFDNFINSDVFNEAVEGSRKRNYNSEIEGLDIAKICNESIRYDSDEFYYEMLDEFG